MEVWVDPVSKRIMAFYDPGNYTGTVWQGLGYERYSKVEPWMLPKEPLPPEPPQPTVIRAEGGKEYIVGVDGKLKAKPEPIPI